MLFFIGIGFMIAGCIAAFMFIRKATRPKVNAQVIRIVMDYYEKDTQRLKQHPHGFITYTVQNREYEAKILLMKRKVQEKDIIVVSYKEDNPEKPTMYAPKTEIITTILLFAIGSILTGVSLYLMDYFNF